MTNGQRFRGRPAFTLVEIIIAASLSCILLATAYQLWFSVRRQSRSVELRIETLASGQRKLHELTREVARARRLVYPEAGGPPMAGVGLVTAEGAVVMYHLRDADLPGRARTLVRTDAATGRSIDILTGMRELLCRVPPVPPGRAPDLVHLTLSLMPIEGAPVHLVTSARLRALDVVCTVNR